MYTQQGWCGTRRDLTFDRPALPYAADAVTVVTCEIAARRNRSRARLKAGVHAWLRDVSAAAPGDQGMMADAVVLHVWSFARDAYRDADHDTRAALAAGAGRGASRGRALPAR